MRAPLRVRRAFTLVELLVTVAIIAVLAGLLFPVFLNARESARQSACATNFRQAGLAIGLYMGDNDDGLMPASYNPNPSATAFNDRRWPQLLGPYVRDRGVFRCPSDRTPLPTPPASFDPDLQRLEVLPFDYEVAKRSSLGYNYTYLSPIVSIAGQLVSLPRQLSSISEVSNTVLGVDAVSRLDQEGRLLGTGGHLVVPPCRFQRRGADRLDTFMISGNVNIFLANDGWQKSTTADVDDFGGAWPRHNGQMNVLFVDGRVKSVRPMSLVAGCALQDNLQGDIFDSMQYSWDLQ